MMFIRLLFPKSKKAILWMAELEMKLNKKS